MDLKQQIEEAFAAEAKKVGFSYEALEVNVSGHDVAVIVSNRIGAVLCRNGMTMGGHISEQRTAHHFANVAVARQADWWGRIRAEHDEDRAVLAGGSPTLRPETRITEPGYYTRGAFAAPA